MDPNNLPLSLEQLQVIWYVAFISLLTGYAILDGLDLGVGILHLFSKEDRERRLMLNSIGPIWDGNEVWLVTAGGALFAGFPVVYASFASAFYVPVMILLGSLIFRAVAIEFRSKQPMAWWRWMWDILFTIGSLGIAFGLGVVVANFVHGIPLDGQGWFYGSFLEFFTPYSMLMGVFTVILFTMHGGIFLMLKTEGEFHSRMRKWVSNFIIAFIMMYAIVTVSTLIYFPHMVDAIRSRPFFFVIAMINMFAIANIPRQIYHGRDMWALISSAVNIVCLMALYAVGMYPQLLRASNDPENLSLTIYNSSSSNLTLHILLIIAIIGIPLVIAYTTGIYYIFRGKVKLDSHSY